MICSEWIYSQNRHFVATGFLCKSIRSKSILSKMCLQDPEERSFTYVCIRAVSLRKYTVYNLKQFSRLTLSSESVSELEVVSAPEQFHRSSSSSSRPSSSPPPRFAVRLLQEAAEEQNRNKRKAFKRKHP
jgi:hypothetical protein